MTRRMSPMPAALAGLLLFTGCEALGTSVASQTATPAATPATAEATRRPRHTPRAEVSPVPAATPDRTRRPRRTPVPSVAPTPTPVPTPPPTPMPPIPGFDSIAGSDGRFTLLLLGSDARGKLVGERTDAIMVLTIDPSTGRMAMAGLPRDTVNVPIEDGRVYESRINALLQSYELGGDERDEALAKTRRALAYAYGIEIDAYLIIGFVGVRKLVDEIGGVEVFLDRAFWDPSMYVTKKGLKLKAGRNRLDGAKALAFARTRYMDSDYQRAARQQQLIVAIITKVLANGADSLPALARMALRHVDTDLTIEALPVLAELAERARLRLAKGVVLGPSQYAEDGPIMYTTQLRIDAVRSMFDRLFGPV